MSQENSIVNHNSGVEDDVAKVHKEKRERRREDRRDQLLEVATRLFSKYGLEGTTTKDIAKEAKVSPGLLYHYYASKEDLLVDVVKKFRNEAEFNKIIDSNDHGPLSEAFCNILKELNEFFHSHIDEIWLITRAAARFPAVSEALMKFRNEGSNSLADFIERRSKAGELRFIKDPRRIAGIICQILVTGNLMQSDNIAIEECVDSILYGLVPRD